MEHILTYQWEIFIFLEVASWLFLFVFLILRYAFSREKTGLLFLFLFILFIILEALLAFIVYQETGEISTFQIIIIIFVVYAFTFGINDFKKLDRFIKEKVGKWRGVELLTVEDKRKMEWSKDPQVIARNNRIWWYAHASIFFLTHWFFWLNYGDTSHSLLYYLTDLSWFSDGSLEQSPYTDELIMQISTIWIIIFALDTIISWSYTFFPEKKK